MEGEILLRRDTTQSLLDEHIRLISIVSDSVEDGLVVSGEHVHSLPSYTSTRTVSSASNHTDTSDLRVTGSRIPPYVALSYRWGTNRATVKADNFARSVPANCVNALRGINKHFPGQLIWTDALSISQDDLSEKSHQVGMMGRIFTEASTTAVWLSEEGNLNGLYTDLVEAAETDADVDSESQSERRIAVLRRLSEMEWFFRVWTFQEIRLSQNAVVLLGDHAMPWNDFISCIQKIRSLEPNVSTVSIRSEPLSHSRFAYTPKDRFFSILDELNAGTSSDLASLLFVTWYRDATVKHDKVYSLLSDSLLTSQDHGIHIDYGIPWSELCIKAARASINVGQNLQILKIAGMTARWQDPLTHRWSTHEFPHLLGHPSWAPNWWHPPQQTRSPSSLAYDKRGVFNALNFACPPITTSQDINDTSPFLSLNGVVLGIINMGNYFGDGVSIHSPPPCCGFNGPDTISDPENDKRFLVQVMMPRFIEDVCKHLDRDCPCVPFHERQSLHQPWQHSSPSFNQNQTVELHFGFMMQSFPVNMTRPPEGKSESEVPAQVLAKSVESGDFLVLLEGGGTPFILRPARETSGRLVSTSHLSPELDYLAGTFVLVGEASMDWDVLWPGIDAWGMHCRAGKFVIV